MLKKTFVHYNEAWYKQPNHNNAIYIEIETGDKIAAFGIEWIPLVTLTAPKFHAFDDAWWALPYIMDVLLMLTQAPEQSEPAYFCEGLKRLGYTDTTPRER
jgi:hypothetical protein